MTHSISVSRIKELYDRVYVKALRLNQTLQEKEASVNLCNSNIESYQSSVESLGESRGLHFKVLTAIKSLIDSVSQEHINHLKDLTTYALKTIFYDRSYSLDIQVRDLRGTKALEFHLSEDLGDGTYLSSDFDGIGGGIKSVVGLILQVYHIQYYDLYPVLIMDEALSNVSSQYIPYLMQFLKELSQQKSFKFILVTHDSRLIDYADTIYEVNQGQFTCKLAPGKESV